MTPRQWQGLAKYFFDMSKITISIAVISQLVARDQSSWKAIAFGTVTGVSFLVTGLFFEKKGDDNE